MTKERNYGGRPSDYKPEYCDEVIELGKKPMSFVEIACHWKVTQETVNEWRRVHPDFSVACTRAKALHDAWFRDQIREGLWETTDTESNGNSKTTKSKRMNGLTMKQYAYLHFGHSERSTDCRHSGLTKSYYETTDFTVKQRILDEALCNNHISTAQYSAFNTALTQQIERQIASNNEKRLDLLEDAQKDK